MASFLELVTVALFFTFTLGGLNADLLVVLLQGCKIFTSLAELTLLHSFADVVMNERTLSVHEIEFVVDPGHHLRDRRAVRDHAARTYHLREVTTRHHGRRLVVDAALESSRGPVDELDRALGLDRRHRRIDVLGNDITAVHHAARHVLAMARIALHHHRCRLEDGVRDLSNA